MRTTAPIYFDNAATSFPKPPPVHTAVASAMRTAGGNPGRGGHILSQRTGAVVYHARETAAACFQGAPERVVFTLNCTHALNLAIQGSLRPGDHVICSDLEHNSVIRPIVALAKSGHIVYSIAHVEPDDAQTVANFRALIRPNTKAIVCTMVSNVTGQILPWRVLISLCQAHGIRFIADGAQACGILPITLEPNMLLCTAGHKGLYGTMGTGMLLSAEGIALTPLMQGGTGSLSHSLQQPEFLPDALEAGTVNVPGIAALDAGMQWVQEKGIDTLYRHETALCERLLAGLAAIPDAVVYRHPQGNYAPVVSFTLKRELPSDTAERLFAAGFCVRAGLHCAPLAHRAIGTAEHGTIRFSPSPMNTPAEVQRFLQVLR